MHRRILLGTGLLAAAAFVLSLLPVAQASRETTDKGRSALAACSAKGCSCADCKCGPDCRCGKACCTCCKDCKCGDDCKCCKDGKCNADCKCCKEGKCAADCKCGDCCKSSRCGKAPAADLGAGCKHNKPASQSSL